MALTQTKLNKWFQPVPRSARPSPPLGPLIVASAVAADNVKQEGDQSCGSTSGPRYVPPLPTELWAQIARMSSSVRQLAQTSRFFKDICRPTLFETMTIEDSDGLERLLGVAQTVHLAGLVKALEIDFSDGLYPVSWPDALSLVCTSVTLLRNLTSFSLERADPDSAYLTYGLQLALLTHPTLREIAYDKFWHQMTYLRPSFERTRSHQLVIHAVTFPQPPYRHTHQSLTLDGLINRLGPYLEHFSIHVRTFHLRVGGHDGPVDSHPLSKLLSATLPALEELHLSFEYEESFPDLLEKGDFLSLFLAVNSSVSRINLATDDDEADMPAHLYLPLEGLTRIRGLDGVGPPDLRDWSEQTPLKEVDLRFRRRADSPGCWDLVGLEVSRTECDGGHDCDVPPDFVGALASKFPKLETLRFQDFFDTDCVLSEFIDPLASFPYLKFVTFPSDYLQAGPDFCYHDAQELEDTLSRAKARWTEEEEDVREDLFGSSFVEDCDPDELEAERDLWESTSDEKDRDPDDKCHTRLLASGLLVARPTVRSFVREEEKEHWLELAKRAPNLERIEWTIHHGAAHEIGTVDWTVVRDGPKVVLHEAAPDRDLDRWVCSCMHRGPDPEKIEAYLDSLPPLFKQEPNFKPAFTLDRFVSRS